MTSKIATTMRAPASSPPARRVTAASSDAMATCGSRRRRSPSMTALAHPRETETSLRLRTGVPDGNLMLIVDLSGRVRSCSPAAAQLFAVDAIVVVGRSIRALIPDIPLRKATPGYNLSFAVFHFTDGQWHPYRGVDTERRAFDIELSIQTMTLDGRHGLILTLRRRTADRAADLDLQHLIASADHRADAIIITDDRGVIEYVNPALEAISGFSRDEAVGRSVAFLQSGMHDTDFHTEMWSAVQQGEVQNRFIGQRKDGEAFHAEMRIRPFVNRFGETVHYVATLRDVSAQVRAYERLEYLANHDGLTGLPNRNLFLDRLHHEIVRANRDNGCFALLFLDVDNFKSINDRFGHLVGDELLRAIGVRLERCLRAVDTVARLGGDEFAMILVGVAGPDSLSSIVDKVRLACKAVSLDGTAAPVSLSIGLAIFPNEGGNEHELIGAADDAMFRAKAGRAARSAGLSSWALSPAHRPHRGR